MANKNRIPSDIFSTLRIPGRGPNPPLGPHGGMMPDVAPDPNADLGPQDEGAADTAKDAWTPVTDPGALVQGPPDSGGPGFRKVCVPN